MAKRGRKPKQLEIADLRVGMVFRDADPRANGRLVKIESFGSDLVDNGRAKYSVEGYPDFAICVSRLPGVKVGRQVRISTARLCNNSTRGYRYVRG